MSLNKKFVNFGSGGSTELTELGTELILPDYPNYASGAPTTQLGINLATAGYKASWILPIKKTGNIQKIYYKAGTTGNTSNVYSISANPVDLTTGVANTTVLWSTNSYVPDYSGVAANATVEKTFTNSIPVSSGDIISFNIELKSFTANSTVVLGINDIAASGGFTPTPLNFSTTWAPAVGAPNIGLEYSDGSFVNCAAGTLQPISTIDTNTLTNNSLTLRMIGNKITPNVRMRVSGFWVWVDADSDITAQLYDKDGTTVLRSIVINKNIPDVTVTPGLYVLYFSSPVVLEKNESYYLGFSNQENTTASVIYSYSAYTSAAKPYLAGGDIMSEFKSATFSPTSLGDYTISDTAVHVSGLIIDALG